MILDERTEFADAAAVAGAAGTYNVGDVVDMSNVRDIGNGQPIYLIITIDTAPTGATTCEFKLVSDSAAPPATDGSATQHWASGAIAIANLPAGHKFVVPLPAEGSVYEEFLGVQETNVGAGALASLKVNAFLSLDPTGWKSLPEGVV